ncbi:flagellin [Ohessyouella blattaphilus]|uniref:Flagellin n=1 Tax=Ohessyouella blattaphilus TaxID=2949333 RepID=A0ABT1EEH1_9FIRM|nr:flagellin [Ohessyouella blattaphilus]MCP1109104.1 flagellin [Ohessyouella blattaphilus]MCR8562498.1 flagellin [Ohessyouella blattaphilus]MDL2250309.1 flagellin [Lachnospiraceae bacterium OttesenSCG-928-J05]
MRIQHNITAINSYRNLTNNNSAVGKNLEKLSSGYRINRAGDDAAGLAISEKMRAQITGLETAQKNSQDAVSLIQTAEGSLTEVHSMLNRMVELATQSANGTYENKVDREAMEAEVTALKSEINRIADSTNFNGKKLLDGSLSADGLTLQVGDTADTFNQITVTVDSMKTADLGVTDAKLDAITIASQTGASAAIDVIKASINQVSTQRAGLGALQNRMEHTINNLSVNAENMTAAESRIRDVDMAKEMMAYTKNNILIQSSQAMLSQANSLPQGVLQLLQ